MFFFVFFASSPCFAKPKFISQVKTVFLDGLSASWDEDYVRKLLKQYGDIVKVELARNMPSARRKDFGFVTFETHDAALICAKSINNEELGEGDHKVTSLTLIYALLLPSFYGLWLIRADLQHLFSLKLGPGYLDPFREVKENILFVETIGLGVDQVEVLEVRGTVLFHAASLFVALELGHVFLL